MDKNKKIVSGIIASVLFVLVISIVAMVKYGFNDKNINAIENKKNIRNIGIKNKKQEKNSTEINENLNIQGEDKEEKDENIKLDNEENLNKYAKKLFQNYFQLDLDNLDIKFKIQKVDIEENKQNLWVCNWSGNYKEKQIYLNLLLDRNSKKIKRIDVFNYSNDNLQKKLEKDEATKIAKNFIKNVKNIDKIEESGEIKVIENSKDGYRVIIPKHGNKENKKGMKDVMVIAVNPFSGKVNSFIDF